MAGSYEPSEAAQTFIPKGNEEQNKDEGLLAIALHQCWVQTRAGHFVIDEWAVKSRTPFTSESSTRRYKCG